jgi:hypothetical protein
VVCARFVHTPIRIQRRSFLLLPHLLSNLYLLHPVSTIAHYLRASCEQSQLNQTIFFDQRDNRRAIFLSFSRARQSTVQARVRPPVPLLFRLRISSCVGLFHAGLAAASVLLQRNSAVAGQCARVAGQHCPAWPRGSSQNQVLCANDGPSVRGGTERPRRRLAWGLYKWNVRGALFRGNKNRLSSERVYVFAHCSQPAALKNTLSRACALLRLATICCPSRELRFTASPGDA